MPEAHAENGDAAAQAPDHVLADARVLRVAWARRQEDVRGLHLLDRAGRYRVVAHHPNIRPDRRGLLVQVVGKGIVIVDQEYHQPSTSDARSIALITARALFALSIYSLCGTESATIRPPACTVTMPSFFAAMRMAMQVSILPARSK